MERLPGPCEILELEDRGVLTTRIVKWETGEVEIHPAYEPEGKWITVLRIHVPKDQKEHFPWYWDITSQALKTRLLPILETGIFEGNTFRITKYGVTPRVRFRLQVT